MEAVRVRLGSLVEWAVAALFLLASVGVASLALRELRATASVSAPAPGVHGRGAGRSHRLGGLGSASASVSRQRSAGRDTLTEVVALLGRAAETGQERADVGPVGERVTRFYDYGGTRFALVFEPVRGQSRVTAIYIQ